MKKLLLLALTAITFIACGDDTTTTTAIDIEKGKSILCINVLNKNTIKELFKEAKELTITREKENYCSYKFKLGSEQFYTHLSVGGIGFANIAMLEQSITQLSASVTKNNKSLKGVGEKAYSTSIAGGQVSAFSDGNLIHVAVTGNKFDEKRTKLLANDILKRMK